MKSKFIIKAGLAVGIMAAVVLSAGLFCDRKREMRADRQGQSFGAGDSGEIAGKNLEILKEKDPEEELENESGEEAGEKEKESVRVEDISFERISSQEIKLLWSDQKNPFVRRYFVRRRKEDGDFWEDLGTVVSDGKAGNKELSYVDVLEAASAQQYEYRIDVETEEDRYEAQEGKHILASNILICIDPGHYAGQNAVPVDQASYAEGDFTLELALELKRILKESCGITAYLTRESGSVSIGGYTDGGLDSGHISLRGEYAEGSDLFLSLHTNANLDHANGYPTYEQLIEIMKPIVIMNTAACENETALAVGNAVGIHLADASYELGIAMPDKFRRAERAEDIVPWTDAWNDGVDHPGTLCRRLGEHGDYYGVLRGAANAGVPGMIIEHGFHTVPKMREEAVFGELKLRWARADAEGIVEGFGFRMSESEEEQGKQ